MSRRTLPSSFLQSNLNNGVGRHVVQLQRLTLKFCKSHGGSRGLRAFIENDLLEFSQGNPGVVVYLKPRRWRAPVLYAEYLNGNSVSIPVHIYTRQEIAQWVEHLRCRNGNQIVPITKPWLAQSPSIQGIWTPYTNKDPSRNVTQFPDARLGAAEHLEPTATEKLMELVEGMNRNNVVWQEDGGEEVGTPV